jgi:hypothetical protein
LFISIKKAAQEFCEIIVTIDKFTLPYGKIMKAAV